MALAEQGKTLFLDIETFSSVDLAKAGVYKYAESEDFEILLFAYSYDNDPVTVLDLTQQDLPEEIILDLLDRNVIKKAHNAQFERICLSAHLRKWQKENGVKLVPGHFATEPAPTFCEYLPPEGWYCTMVHSSMCGLPSSLKQVGEALGLSEDKKKLATGQALIRYFCTPCAPTKSNGRRTRNLPADDPEKWKQFIEYNRRDVETEMEIEKSLSHHYIVPFEELQRYWLDQRIADKGIGVDMDLVGKILAYGEVHQKAVADEALQLSGCPIGRSHSSKPGSKREPEKRLLA